MQCNTQYYKRLDRDRRRTLALGYNLSGVPVDDAHEELIERREREARERSQQPMATTASRPFPSSPPDHWNHRPQDSSPREDQSFSGSYGSSPSEQGNLSLITTTSGQEEAERSIRFPDINGPGELLPKNVWPILLYFEDKRQWEGKVLLDSGAKDNWISERTVRQNGFPRDDEDDEESYEDFNGRGVKSCGVVRAQWIFRHQTIPVKFKIAPNAPWEVLFGYCHLIETNVITINHDQTNRWVAPLTKKTRKSGPEEKEHMKCVEEGVKTTSRKIRDFLEWKKRMNKDNWHWDKEHNNFYRETPQGGKEWCKDGWQIDFLVDEALHDN